jgi:hypothetical protein
MQRRLPALGFFCLWGRWRWLTSIMVLRRIPRHILPASPHRIRSPNRVLSPALNRDRSHGLSIGQIRVPSFVLLSSSLVGRAETCLAVLSRAIMARAVRQAV